MTPSPLPKHQALAQWAMVGGTSLSSAAISLRITLCWWEWCFDDTKHSLFSKSTKKKKDSCRCASLAVWLSQHVHWYGLQFHSAQPIEALRRLSPSAIRNQSVQLSSRLVTAINGTDPTVTGSDRLNHSQILDFGSQRRYTRTNVISPYTIHEVNIYTHSVFLATISQIWLLRSITHTKACYFYGIKVSTFHRFCTTICSAVICYSANPCAAVILQIVESAGQTKSGWII